MVQATRAQLWRPAHRADPVECDRRLPSRLPIRA